MTPHPKCEYANDGTRITAPGKFEGEPVFARDGVKRETLYRLQYACQLHNHHTSPSAMRSDFEHTIHRKAARKIHRWLTNNFSRYAWREMDSGRLEAL